MPNPAPSGLLDGWIVHALGGDDPEAVIATAHLLCSIHLGLPELTEQAWGAVLADGSLIYPTLVSARKHLIESDREDEAFRLSQAWKSPLTARPHIDGLRDRAPGRQQLEMASFYAAFDTLQEGVRQLREAEDMEAFERALVWTLEAGRSVASALDAYSVTRPLEALRLGRAVWPDELIDALPERGGAVCLVDLMVAPEGTLIQVLGRSGGSVGLHAIMSAAFTLDHVMHGSGVYERYVVSKAEPERVHQALEDVTRLLHDRLWCHLAREIGRLGFSQIILVPDAWTRALPHHLARVCGREVPIPEDVAVVQRERLCDLFPVETVPSVQMVAMGQWVLRPRPIRKVVMVADPGGDLAGAAWSARVLADRLADGIEYRPLLGPAATRARVLEEAADAQVIGFSCHGRFLPDRVSDSGLMLADADLALQDVVAGDAVTPGAAYLLSACELGTGVRGEHAGGFAFPGALLANGAAFVLGALWEIEDIPFGYLTDRFLHYLAHPGYRPCAALFRAMNDLKSWSRKEIAEHLNAMLDWMRIGGRAHEDADQEAYLQEMIRWMDNGAEEFPYRDIEHSGGYVIIGSGWAGESGAHALDAENPMRQVEVMLARPGRQIAEHIREGRFDEAQEALADWLAWAHGPERIEPCTLEADLAAAAVRDRRFAANLYGRLRLLARAHGADEVERYAVRRQEELRRR